MLDGVGDGGIILLRGTSPRSLRMLVIVSSVDGLFQLNDVDDDELHPGVGFGPNMDFMVRNAKYPWAIVVPIDANAAPPLMMS